MKKRFLFSLFIVLFFHIPNVFSQQVSFTPISFKSEKNISAFLGVSQDQLGYIWLTSYNGGIYRYDGSFFVNFQHSDTNSNTIASDHTECIYIDSSDIIWIGTYGQGLDRFDPVTNQFTHFRHDARKSSSLANDTVTAILEDREGNFWVGNYGGLDLFERGEGIFKHYPQRVNDVTSLSSNHVRSIYEDHQGTIWIGCGAHFANDNENLEEGGLNRFNRMEGNFTRYLHDPGNPSSLESNKVKALFEDSKGNFWVGTFGNGLHIMDRSKGTFTHYYYDSAHPENLSRPPVSKNFVDHITFINEDILGGIWIGSFLGGINRYDPVTKKTTHFGNVGRGIHTLPTLGRDTSFGYTSFSSWGALFVPDGQIWITSFGTGTNDILFNATLVKKTIPFYPESKRGGNNTFYYDADSILWIGTDSGLIRKNLILQTEKLFVEDPKNTNSLTNKNINVIRVDKDKNIWLGTNGGLNKYDPHTNYFTAYRHDPKINSSLSNDSVLSMCQDHNDDLWVGTLHGLDKMDKRTGLFTHFKLETRSGIRFGELVYCIREDQGNELWAGTQDGLYHVNINTGSITSVLPKAIVISICVDSKNEVWIGADTSGESGEQSLYRYDRNHSQFVLFIDQYSLGKISHIIDIMEDKNKNLWVSTKDAIVRINEKRDGLKKYGAGYGVHPNNFQTGDNFKSSNGKLFFGDLYGYYSLYPDELKDNNQLRLNFTSFKLNGKEAIPSLGGILKLPIWRTEKIRLAHNENSFSFEFSGINYQSPGEVKYLFMLENYDDAWQRYGTEHRAYYFNLPPGNYTFHIKAFTDDGGMSEKSIRIIILPPWWKTWWAYMLLGLSVIGAVWGFIHYRSEKLRRENRLLEEKVTRRTNQLNLSLEELKSAQSQLIQSEKMASLGELTAGIAHEIQNPLNFVNNFSEINKELLVEMKGEIKKGNLDEVNAIANDVIENEDKISHHGKRADVIVKGMLQHSRTSSGQKEPSDINGLADEWLRLSYHGLRAKDGLFNSTTQTDFDPTIGKINIIPQDIGRVLMNLYNNAFYAVTEKKKHQPVGYEPNVSVSTRRIGNKVEIRVKDNGTGISQKIIDKIFQPFFTTKPTGQGTGLGLSLSYDIIKAHGGEFKVNSREGEGAEFIVQIQVI